MEATTKVSDRTIKVKTIYHDEHFDLKFTTSQQYNKVYYALMEQKPRKPNDFVTIDNVDNKTDLHTDSILFFYYPDNAIVRYPDCMRILTLVFEDKQKLSIMIQGTKRAKHAYEAIKVILDKDPTNFFLSILQEDNKYALIKHYSRIREIYLNESPDEKTALNG